MSHLIQEYAKSCGVKIGKPEINPIFYPIPYDKYITIVNGVAPATSYPYWAEAFESIQDFLKDNDIKILQILEEDQRPSLGVDAAIRCSKKQAAFVIKGAVAHIGTESVLNHIAGLQAKPMVCLYSHTNPKNTEPWFAHATKTKTISSLEEGKTYSYDLKDTSIRNIKPEEVSQAILDVLDSNYEIKTKTLLIGERYEDTCNDIIPKYLTSARGDKINVRMDIHHDETVLADILKRNVVEVCLSNPISDEILNSRRIKVINYIAEEFDEAFVKKVKSLGITINLLCVSEEKLAAQRLKFFDFEVILHDILAICKENAEKLNKISTKSIKSKSNKKIILGDKVFYSYLEATESKELFLLDLDWMLLYTHTHE
ncbi:glycosyltransferase family 9 protein [bacterium]|nr:glycosyltransferase family 9 protein [bacterium]